MATLAERTNQLELAIQQAKAKLEVNPSACIPTSLIVAVIFPILLFLVLWWWSPGFVKTTVNGKSTRSTAKVFFWTVGITALVWLFMYMYARCDNFKNISKLCFWKPAK